MASRSPMALKDAKARRMSMQEFKYIQSRGDAADYRAGRYVPAYHGYRFTHDDVNEKWGYDHALKPIEQWAVRNGYAQNPFDDIRKKHQPVTNWFPVYFSDGTRRMCRSLDEACNALASGAVKMFDGEKYVFA